MKKKIKKIMATRNLMAETDSKNESAPKSSPYISIAYTKSVNKCKNLYLLQGSRYQMYVPLTSVLKGLYSWTSADSLDNTSGTQLSRHRDTINAIQWQSLDRDLQTRSTDTAKHVHLLLFLTHKWAASYMLTKIFNINFSNPTVEQQILFHIP